MVAQGKTFQQQHQKYFKYALFFSLYPPGVEEFIKSKIILKIFWYISLMPILQAVPYAVALANYIIFHGPESTVLRIQIFRRALIITYMGFELATHAFRFRAIESLYNRWNQVIHKDYCIVERQVVLDRMTSASTVLLLRFGIIRFITSVGYNIPLWFNRNMRGSDLAGFPHDTNSPYHFYYVGYQTLFFLWFAFAMIAFEFLNCFLLCMAEAEIEVLGRKLSEILSTITISDDNHITVRKFQATSEVAFGSPEYKEAVERVNEELARWLKAHQEAKKWLQDLKDFMHLVITVKYTYLGVHCSLVVVGLSGMGSMVNDLILTMVVTIANFSFCFNATVQADRLYDDSEKLFAEAYSQGWYLYPVSTQKTLAIIATVSQNRPEALFGFKIYRDSKENFLAVLQTAYQVLTFILPMAES